MYLTSNDDNVARTKNQLNPVRRNEKEPENAFNYDNENYKIVEILDQRVVNRKTEYEVRLKGRPIRTKWVNSSELNKTNELKKLKRDFNDQG